MTMRPCTNNRKYLRGIEARNAKCETRNTKHETRNEASNTKHGREREREKNLRRLNMGRVSSCPDCRLPSAKRAFKKIAHLDLSILGDGDGPRFEFEIIFEIPKIPVVRRNLFIDKTPKSRCAIN